MTPAQLPLALAQRPALGRDDFLVAPSNAAAVAWLDRWPDWPAPALVLCGPQGCGKTHLAHVFAARSGAAVLAAAALPGLDPTGLAHSAPALVVEDFEPGGDERALLHLYNCLAEAGRRLLLTAVAAPARRPPALADLRSRLLAVPTVAILPPDDALLAAVLVKLFADRQLRLGAEVIDYLCRRIERSFAAAGAVVARIDARALAARRPVTVALVREVLAGAP